MGITSFYFIIFYAVVLLLYYLLPKKCQWMVLLAASILYYLLSGNALLIFYPLSAVMVCFIGIRIMAMAKENGQRLREAGKNPEKRVEALPMHAENFLGGL